LKSGDFLGPKFPKKSIVDVGGPFFFRKMAKVCDNKKYWFRFPGLYHDVYSQVKGLPACANCWYLGALNIACAQSSYCTQDKRSACFFFLEVPLQDVPGAAHTPFGFCYGLYACT
jgi:hypothetical protein